MSSKQFSTLILLTSEYPFGKGETFLESEIQYLAAEFEQVIILSDYHTAEKTRQTPENVQSMILKKNRSFQDYLSFLDLDFLVEFLSNLFRNPLKNKIAIKSWLYARYWLNNIRKLDPKQAVLYSYWLDDKAIALASLKKQQADLTVISRAHRWDIYPDEHLYAYLPFRPFLFAYLDNIYSISEDGIESLKKQGAKKVELSRLGTKTPQLKHNQPSQTLHLVSISYLLPRKRMNLLLEALKLMAKDGLAIRWTHFGDGPMMDELVESSKAIPEIPIDFQGFKKNPEVLQWLQNNAQDCVLVNLSESEGIPVSMMEAMSYGVPCIGTDVGGVKEIIEDGENGFLLNPHPSELEIAEKIRTFYKQSNEDKNRMKENALKTWNEKYSAQTNFQQFCRKIASLT